MWSKRHGVFPNSYREKVREEKQGASLYLTWPMQKYKYSPATERKRVFPQLNPKLNNAICEVHVISNKVCQSLAQLAPLMLIKMTALVSENN